MKSINFMVGLPGSGKSTYAKLLAKELDGIVVSSDGIRAEWYGSEEILGDAGKIFREVEKRCREALERGQSVVMDATNLNAKKRKAFLEKMPKDASRVCIVMAVPFDECVKRDQERPRHVGIDVLEKMRKNFQMPYYNEGWDHIEIYYPKDCELISAEHHYEMEIKFDQKNSHHSMTVGDHEEMAQTIAGSKGYLGSVQWAAGYHDCGKIWCQHYIEGDDNAHYYGHASVSAYQFLTMDSTEFVYGIRNREAVVETAALITWHMTLYQFKGEWDEREEQFREWAADRGFDREFTEHLWQLHECDVCAH